MRTVPLGVLIGLTVVVALGIGPGAERLQAGAHTGQCGEIHNWTVTYVEPFRGHLLRIIVRDPISSAAFPRVGYWITLPEHWTTERQRSVPIVRGCQDAPGGEYAVEIQTEKGDWLTGRTLRVNKLSSDWRRISFTVLADPDDPSSVVTERVVEIPE